MIEGSAHDKTIGHLRCQSNHDGKCPISLGAPAKATSSVINVDVDVRIGAARDRLIQEVGGRGHWVHGQMWTRRRRERRPQRRSDIDCDAWRLRGQTHRVVSNHIQRMAAPERTLPGKVELNG